MKTRTNIPQFIFLKLRQKNINENQRKMAQPSIKEK